MERERGSFRPKINMNASILQTENWPDCRINTAQKVPVCGFILVRIFPAFSRNLFSANAGKCGKNADQNNCEYGHFLRSVNHTHHTHYQIMSEAYSGIRI